MLCSIFRSLFWVQTIATKVKYGFFHLRDGVDSQNVSDFGSFGIWVFRGRDAQPVETCFLQWVLRMPAIMFTFPGPASQTVWWPPPHDLSADDCGCVPFLLPLGNSAGQDTLGVFRILLFISWISSFSLLSPATRGHWCSISC